MWIFECSPVMATNWLMGWVWAIADISSVQSSRQGSLNWKVSLHKFFSYWPIVPLHPWVLFSPLPCAHLFLRHGRPAGISLGYVDVVKRCPTAANVLVIYKSLSHSNMSTKKSSMIWKSIEFLTRVGPDLQRFIWRNKSFKQKEYLKKRHQGNLKLLQTRTTAQTFHHW